MRMSISFSGIEDIIAPSKVVIEVTQAHPLIKLGQSLPWSKLAKLIFSDLQKTDKGCWWLGRKLEVRIHLGVYFLQQIFNYTDREIEYAVKDNAAFQLFCGRDIVENWHAPDHTKIEKFRSRLSRETQQALANHITVHAVALGFAHPENVDIDSTVQEANMTYPADSVLLKKLGAISKKLANFFNKKIEQYVTQPLQVNMKAIASKAREYFFLKKTASTEIKSEKMLGLWSVVTEETRTVIEACKTLSRQQIKKMPWNIKRSVEQIRNIAVQYLDDVRIFIATGAMVATKRISFHLKEVACFSKGKLGKKYQFGRAFQLARTEGNFFIVAKCDSVPMPDKTTFPAIIKEVEKIVGDTKINSVATDKGYYSKKNEKLLNKKGINEIAIQRPCNIKSERVKPLSAEREEALINRRSGIEPLIGHVKQGGQLGRSRMKSDAAIECSGYTAVLGFNMRQLMRYQKPPDMKKAA